MPRRLQETPSSPTGLDRIVFFSDAVIAIAVTLTAPLRRGRYTAVHGPIYR